MLLFGAMALVDTKSFYPEQEELVEGNEIEREELKESDREHDWIKLLLTGGTDCLSARSLYQLQHLTSLYVIDFEQYVNVDTFGQIPLFLMYCCLKIPFS